MKKVTKQCDCEKQMQGLQSQVEEWKNKYVRALADYQNLERRTQEEKQEIRKFAAEVVLERLLPAVDTLKRAKEYIKDVGLDLAFKELMAVLQEQGVGKMHVIGELFDPHTMECVEVVEGKDNVVIEETLSGYTLHGKVLRIAQVKVGKESINL